MYSGTTINKRSGRLLGAHQKVDRTARKALEAVLPGCEFPEIKQILHFEGMNGPDGIKRKSPAQDEPWHYYDPTDPKDTAILEHIDHHFKALVKALKQKSEVKVAFEAAWLAHALVDGLTPAHHFPLHKRLEELRGEGLETRTSIREKLIIKGAGDTRREMLVKNWQYWGAKGIMTTHGLYEWGVATIIRPLRLRRGYLRIEDLKPKKDNLIESFKDTARHIHSFDMYNRFARSGWTRTLARETREVLAPALVRIVVLAWYLAIIESKKK